MVTPEIIQIVKKEFLDHKSWEEIRSELKFNGWPDSDIKVIYASLFPKGQDSDSSPEKKLDISIAQSYLKPNIKATRIIAIGVLTIIVILVDILFFQINPDARQNLQNSVYIIKEYSTGLKNGYSIKDIRYELETNPINN